ncbi:effector binding domain-containing protein [Paenibacillus sp. UMB4589-SE434]|uniref:GyrI-like domain-containing protein n=1 Tax=Paenibacillus sp. UMB4589-SE434 TaxID=3046314 RepID=UPI00254E8BEE|nr:effector binding domain-containing protein [Paenibacillus sp. UMB4589-SE434]MDK8183347.1 effector binding domain-containing protein [Paenibacillus sp. UMB4589-SE434]
MSNFRFERKEGFRLVGYKTALEGSSSVHSPLFTTHKTTFFREALENGHMALLRPLAESSYGYAAIAVEQGKVFYYAGVKTLQPVLDQTEEVLFPESDYLVLTGNGGLSRLAFDRLEDQAFNDLLNDDCEWAYTGAPIAEILLNGKPSDAQVEVWIPVKKRNKH